MKMLPQSTFHLYGRVCRALRARGQRLGLLELGLCADLAMELERDEPDEAVVVALLERLELGKADVVEAGDG